MKLTDGRRQERVQREVLALVSEFLFTGYRGEDLEFVSLTRVSMPPDLKSAKIFVNVIGDAGQRKKAAEILQSRAWEIQAFIGKNLRLRSCPKLVFLPDESIDRVLKIERLLQEVQRPNTP